MDNISSGWLIFSIITIIIYLVVMNAIYRHRLFSRENISKSDLEMRLDKTKHKLAEEIGARHDSEKLLSVESDKALRFEQAYKSSQRQRDEERDKFDKLLKEKLKESNNRQRATIKGQMAEQLAPHLPGFKHNPKDARFLGMPVDYIVYDGMSDGEIKEVIFVEVKTNTSQLSTIQRKIRDAIQDKRVSWEVCRIVLPDNSK